MTYKQDINSREWKLKRLQYLCNSNGFIKCFCCRKELFFGEESIHVHHKTYKNFQNENLKDLLSLCPECHIKIHKLNRSFGIELDKCHRILRKTMRITFLIKEKTDGLKNIDPKKKKLERYVIYQMKKDLKPFKYLAF